MRRDVKSTSPPANARAAASVDVVALGDATLVSISGLVDERFAGFGDLGAAKTVILNVAGMTRLTSFGVRQWLKAMGALPKSISDLYLLGCPTFFVDQLNMVLNFGGTGKVLSVMAPFTCPSCGTESGETVDVLAERASLSKGAMPDKECARCGSKLEFDETPESYFAFVGKYAASSIQPAAAQLLASLGLYTSVDGGAEKPPRIIKLVHGSVTYFRIIGTIGSMFRARPFLVGAEGEVVIDLAEVSRFDPAGQKEWKRLLKSLSSQVSAVTLVDVSDSFLATAGDTLTVARNIVVSALLVPYGCVECRRTSPESVSLQRATFPLRFAEQVCPTCGGTTQSRLPPEALAPLQKASTSAPPASAKVIEQREELVSRALIDANVAQAGENATAAVSTDDTILGKYKIVRRLSAGGMAEVFLAKQVGIGGFEKVVALKRIQRKLLETRHLAIELFLNEAKIAGRLTHPSIVQVLDVGEVQGALYLAMEYVHGKDLRRVIKKLQQSRIIMPLAEACHIVREVALALDHAYWSTDMTGKRLSVVHRDVSPHNIILSYEGAVKLLDFGVAMSSVTEHAETMIVGKWLYMSPETTANEQVDHRSDLFSLGVILYLLCSGYMPFTGPSPKEIVKKIRAGQYKPLQEIVAVPEELAWLVARLLAPNPDDRPQRGQDVAAELSEISRQYGIETSASGIAYIVKQLFSTEGSGATEQRASSIREIVRAEEAGSAAYRSSGIPSAISPNSVSLSSRGGLSPVDISESFQQRTGRMSAGSSISETPWQQSEAIPVPSQSGNSGSATVQGTGAVDQTARQEMPPARQEMPRARQEMPRPSQPQLRPSQPQLRPPPTLRPASRPPDLPESADPWALEPLPSPPPQRSPVTVPPPRQLMAQQVSLQGGMDTVPKLQDRRIILVLIVLIVLVAAAIGTYLVLSA
ncbi:MAG TPA: protein kinase [Kofleriaceae bacterium]|nr:protein kinase [Kofleriaceae bacterium]